MKRRGSSLPVLVAVVALLAAGCGAKSHKASVAAGTTSTTGEATSSSVPAASGAAASTSTPTTLGRATTVVTAAPGSRSATTPVPGSPATTAGAPAATTASGATQSVHATGPPNYGFTPSTLSVAAGSKVVVTNDSQAAPHTWTADDGSFDSGTIAAGGTSAPITLTKKGTYGFYCEIHGAALMHGTVTVT